MLPGKKRPACQQGAAGLEKAHGKEGVVVMCANREGGGDYSANGDAQPRCSAKRGLVGCCTNEERGEGGAAAAEIDGG